MKTFSHCVKLTKFLQTKEERYLLTVKYLENRIEHSKVYKM